ncbi:MAG: hypothetical protein WCB97_00980 [Thiobacillus sp.]
MNQQMAESTMHVFSLHLAALDRERKEKALDRIKRQRFFSPVQAPVDEAAAAFIRHITTPELEPQPAAEADDLDWLIDSLDPISCRPEELDRLFHQCRRAGDAEKAAYLLGCRDVRMRISLLEGTDEWRALESVAEKSKSSSPSQPIACGHGQ